LFFKTGGRQGRRLGEKLCLSESTQKKFLEKTLRGEKRIEKKDGNGRKSVHRL